MIRLNQISMKFIDEIYFISLSQLYIKVWSHVYAPFLLTIFDQPQKQLPPALKLAMA